MEGIQEGLLREGEVSVQGNAYLSTNKTGRSSISVEGTNLRGRFGDMSAVLES